MDKFEQIAKKARAPYSADPSKYHRSTNPLIPELSAWFAAMVLGSAWLPLTILLICFLSGEPLSIMFNWETARIYTYMLAIVWPIMIVLFIVMWFFDAPNDQ